jgi:hypothetical protein
MKQIRRMAAAALLAALGGCSTWWPFGSSGEEQKPRLPEGAVEYSCAQGKQLVVRFTADRKSAWVYFPDREFRLDRTGSDERYGNGVSTLVVRDEVVSLDADGGLTFAECARTKP